MTAARSTPGASSISRTPRPARIGIAQKGSGEVEVESILPAGAPVTAAAQPLPPVGAAAPAGPIPVAQEPGGYVVQLGAFANYANAQAFVAHVTNQIAPLGVEARVHETGGLFRVVVGPYPTRDEASRSGDRLRTAVGLDNMVRTAMTRRTAVETRAMPRSLVRWHPLLRLILLICALGCAPAHAQLTIEIIGGGGDDDPDRDRSLRRRGELSVPADRDRRRRSCAKRPVQAGRCHRGQPQACAGRGRSLRGVDRPRRGCRRRGSVTPRSDGRVEVRFSRSTPSSKTSSRRCPTSSRRRSFAPPRTSIADVIYEKLTGNAGVFSTRIAYIAKQGPRFQLLVAEADGFNPQTIVTSNEPLLSPVWSPDGTRIAYVSLENKKPIVYIQSLGHRATPGAGELPRQQQRAGLGTRQQPARGHALRRTAVPSCT